MKTEDLRSFRLLGTAHFFVDVACTALLTRAAEGLLPWQITACAVLYNGLAFAFQLPIGALGDGLKLQRSLAALGCFLVAAGSLIPAPLAMAVIIGLGNACFHVGGGREAMKRSGRRAAGVGRFVAPGAIGIFLGPRLAGIGWLVGAVLPAGLLIFAAALAVTRRRGAEAERRSVSGLSMAAGRRILVCGCMFLTVLLRSWMGTALAYPFLSEFGWALCFALCIFGGKHFGGILADRFGMVRFCLAAQVMGTGLFMLSVETPVLAFPAVFLFNTTMAVTASRLYACVPRFPGTMFGLTTFALYLGALPRLLGWTVDLFRPLGLGLLSLVSAFLLMAGIILSEGGESHGRSDRTVAGAVSGTDTGD